MQKPLALSIAACLVFTGCQVFEKSAAWKEAVSVRPGAALREPDPSHAYANQLHTALADKGIEHKVITYQYRYTTRLREEAVGTRTAVVYRDNTTGKYPWWLKDERLNTPVWLPNGDADAQVSFYIRRKAEVIESQVYPGQEGAAKSTLAFARPTPPLRSVNARPEPQVADAQPAPAPTRRTEAPVLVSKPEPAPAVSKPVVAKANPIRKETKPASVVEPKKIAKAPEKRKPVATEPRKIVKAQPKAKSAAAAKIAKAKAPAPKVKPTATTTVKVTSPNRHLEAMFKRKHGTEYNRLSPLDRRKMQAMHQGLASRG